MSNFVEKYSFCGYIVDNFFDVFVGKALRRGERRKIVWITRTYPQLSTKLSTNSTKLRIREGGFKNRCF